MPNDQNLVEQLRDLLSEWQAIYDAAPWEIKHLASLPPAERVRLLAGLPIQPLVEMYAAPIDLVRALRDAIAAELEQQGDR